MTISYIEKPFVDNSPYNYIKDIKWFDAYGMSSLTSSMIGEGQEQILQSTILACMEAMDCVCDLTNFRQQPLQKHMTLCPTLGNVSHITYYIGEIGNVMKVMLHFMLPTYMPVR